MKNEIHGIAKGELQVWYTSLAIDDAKADKCYVHLSKDEKTRADRFAYPLHRRRFIAARAGLRFLLGSYLHCSPDDIVFSYTDKGKPFILNSSLGFNLAHSEDLAVYGFCLAQDVGVDVEFIHDTFNEGIADRFFTEGEAAALKKITDATQRKEMFYSLWVRKEALVKARGEGLVQSLNAFHVDVEKPEQIISVDHEKWFIQTLSIDDAYQAGLAMNEKPKSITIQDFNLNAF